MRYLIAGCGPAGVHCAEAIRRRDKDAPITMLSPEGCRPYSRVTVPEYMTGEIAQEHIYFRPGSFFSDAGIEVHTRRLVSLSPEARTAVLDDGTKLAYDSLLLATGSRPAVPLWADMSLPGVYSLWGKDDAERLASKIASGDTAVIIGGGLVGLQAARALNDHGLRVTVLEAAGRLMPRQLDEAASDMLRSAAEARGVRIKTGVSVTKIRRQAGRACGVMLKSGERFEASHILVCAGVRPNLEMLEGIEADWERGVEVDERMRTAVPGVYAAGDIVKAPLYGEGERGVRAIWLNAVQQGVIAGINMAGGDAAYDGSRTLNSIQLFGLAIASAGRIITEPNMREIRYFPASAGNYRKITLSGDVLTGAILVGEIQAAGPLFARLGESLTGISRGFPSIRKELVDLLDQDC